MAEKKKNTSASKKGGNSNSNSGAKKSAPKRKTKAEMIAEQEAMEQRSNEVSRVVGIVIFALSVLLFFIAVISGDGLWTILHNFYIGLFGWFAAITFPILCLLYSILYVKNPEKKMTYEIVSIVILVLLLSTIIHIFINNNGDEFKTAVTQSYLQAPSQFNGGLFGALFGWLLLTLGKAPAIIVDLILIFVDVMLLSRKTVNQFLKNTAKPVQKVVEKAAPYIEERRERRNNNNIDIYLDEEPPQQEELDGSVRDNMSHINQAEEQSEDETDAVIRMMKESSKKRRSKKSEENKEERTEEKEEPKDNKETQKEDVKDAKDFEVPEENLIPTENQEILPPVSLLKKAGKSKISSVADNNRTAQLLIETLNSFGVSAKITHISNGPTVTRYELKPAAGVRISKITNLADDIALNLAATHVRIEAPIPGKAAVGIEVPNSVKNSVLMSELIDNDEFRAQKSLLSAGIGKDIAGNPVYCDIAKMPHLLIAGTTGSGKSVCMNSIIVSILYRATSDKVKFLMIDPKKVEFSKYEGIPHLLVPVVTDPRKASGALGWAVSEMLKRYQKFSDTGVRDIEGYNRYVLKHSDLEPMPKVVICIDELADLMMAAPKEVEDSICRLAQMARAAGMHLVIATQRPSVDVITGLIKANISSRIALTVSSQIDSRTILDSGGAEKLLGRGDMLYSPIGSSKPQRVQGCFISDDEVEHLCEFIKNQGESQYDDSIQKEIEAKAAQDPKESSKFLDDDENEEQLDPLFEKAVDVVLENGRASTSFLQRKLSVGYSRGSKIMDQLEEKGVIGPQDGAKPREIRINKQQWLEMQAYSSNIEFTAENTEQMSFDSEDDDDNNDIEDNVIDNQELYE
ncbi:MAG: DNA translocase FtsK [Eubacterium sp.]